MRLLLNEIRRFGYCEKHHRPFRKTEGCEECVWELSQREGEENGQQSTSDREAGA